MSKATATTTTGEVSEDGSTPSSSRVTSVSKHLSLHRHQLEHLDTIQEYGSVCSSITGHGLYVFDDDEEDGLTLNTNTAWTTSDTAFAVASQCLDDRLPNDQRLGREQPPPEIRSSRNMKKHQNQKHPTTKVCSDATATTSMETASQRRSQHVSGAPTLTVGSSLVTFHETRAPTVKSIKVAPDDDDHTAKRTVASTLPSSNQSTPVPPLVDKIPKSLRRRREFYHRRQFWNLAAIALVIVLLLAAVILGTIFGIQEKETMENERNSNTIPILVTEPPSDEVTTALTLFPTTWLQPMSPSASPADSETASDPSTTTETPSFEDNITIAAAAPIALSLPPSFAPSTSSPSVSLTTSSVLTACTLSEKPFPNSTSISMAILASSNVSQLQLEYAASVFQKTYNSLSICDVHCRHISKFQLSKTTTTLLDATASVPSSSSTAACDAMLEVLLELEGTYVGCIENGVDDFPGLSSFSEETRRKLHIILPKSSSSHTTRGNLRKNNNWNQKRMLHQETETAFQCPTATTSDGITASTPSCQHNQIFDDTNNDAASSNNNMNHAISTMNEYFDSIPGVCRIESLKDNVV